MLFLEPRFKGDVIKIFKDPSKPFKETYEAFQDTLLYLSNLGLNVNIRADIKIDAEKSITELFDKLKSILNDFAFVANELIEKSKLLVEDLINNVFKNLTDLVSNISKKISNLLDQAEELGKKLILKLRELNDQIFNNLKEFRQALFEDLHNLIDHAVVAGQLIITGTFEQIIEEIRRPVLAIQDFLDHINIFDPDSRKRKKISDEIKKDLSISLLHVNQWGHTQIYDYLCQYTLKVESYEIEKKQGKERIGNIETMYADLQDKAWRLSTLGLTDSSLSKEAMEDWVKYGQLYELWHKLGDEDMGLLDAINDKLKELDQAEDEFKEKSAQIESLREELKNRSAQIESSIKELQEGLTNGRLADRLHKHTSIYSKDSEDRIFFINNKNYVEFKPQPVLYCPDRFHIFTEELLYLLSKDGVMITKDFGSSGNLVVTGDLTVQGNISHKGVLL